MYVYVAVTGRNYSTVSGRIRLLIVKSLDEITPDFLCPFMND